MSGNNVHCNALLACINGLITGSNRDKIETFIYVEHGFRSSGNDAAAGAKPRPDFFNMLAGLQARQVYDVPALSLYTGSVIIGCQKSKQSV